MSRSLGVQLDLARPQKPVFTGFSSVVSSPSGENLEVRGTNRGTQLSAHMVFGYFSDFLSRLPLTPKRCDFRVLLLERSGHRLVEDEQW
jgi:hypothetical protein